jgi:hypothetical protein
MALRGRRGFSKARTTKKLSALDADSRKGSGIERHLIPCPSQLSQPEQLRNRSGAAVYTVVNDNVTQNGLILSQTFLSSDWGLLANGNENREHGPTATWPGRGSKLNRAGVFFDDSLADPQPQSASIASLG